MISACPTTILVLLSFIYCCCHGVSAWQSSSGIYSRPTTIAKATITTNLFSHLNDDGHQQHRRQFLLQIITGTTTVTAAAAIIPHQEAMAAVLDAGDAREQWKACSSTTDDLLKNWNTEEWAEKTSGGDIVRIQLGRVDTTSSLFQIEKAFKVLRDSEFVDDEIEFVEATEEFMEALYRADLFAQDSNLRTGSGKQTPPAVSLENSKKEVITMQGIAKRLNSMVK